MSRRRSIVPCGIDDSDLEALRADDASFYGQDCAVSDTDSDHETARAAKRVDRSGEGNDEISATLIFLSILGLEPQPNISQPVIYQVCLKRGFCFSRQAVQR